MWYIEKRKKERFKYWNHLRRMNESLKILMHLCGASMSLNKTESNEFVWYFMVLKRSPNRVIGHMIDDVDERLVVNTIQRISVGEE